MRRPSPWVIFRSLRGRLPLLALALGVVLPAAPVPTASPPVRISAASPFALCLPVEIEGQPVGGGFVNAEVEPRVAVNPATIGTGHVNAVAVWQQDRWSSGGARGLMAGYSFDGGRTWKRSTLPFTACAPGGLAAQAASDPWVSIGPDGTVYAVGLTLAVVPPGRDVGVAAATSSDGGRTWKNVQMVARDTAESSDKESVTADPMHPGVAYVVWDRIGGNGGGQPLWFARTLDGGRTWSEPSRIAAVSGETIGHQIVVDPRSDTLYDFYSRGAPLGAIYCQPERENCSNPPATGQMLVTRSTDMGLTWSSPRLIATFHEVGVGKSTGLQVRTGDRLPEAAIDRRTGRLYVIWQDSRFSAAKADGIALSISSDGGAHWSKPRQIPSPPGLPAVTATLAVTQQGVVGATFYTFRSGPNSMSGNFWFSRSTDQGQTFSKPLHLAGLFDLMLAPYARGFFLGDYEGLAANGSAFVSVFVMTNARSTGNRTDVYATRIQP
ncbi:MAG TPA: sialidase family protein [Chloroflexota bacterium]|nr:sialidase family protein [Chloroflexota bacterium]